MSGRLRPPTAHTSRRETASTPPRYLFRNLTEMRESRPFQRWTSLLATPLWTAQDSVAAIASTP
jgi:hypothetical protein